jgi:hypothetical protein
MTLLEQLEAILLTSTLTTENLRVLIAAHALDFKNGSITIHYDQDGRIRKVENHLVSFKS